MDKMLEKNLDKNKLFDTLKIDFYNTKKRLNLHIY